MNRLEQAQIWAEEQTEEALKAANKVAEEYLTENPNDVQALTLMTYIAQHSGHPAVAYQLAKRCIELEPRFCSGYLNLGIASEDLWRRSEAERAYKKAIDTMGSDESAAMIYSNISALHVDYGEWEKAEKFARLALRHKPDAKRAKDNLAFAQLAKRQWPEGWKNYKGTIGSEWRQRFNYADEPDWNGNQVGTLVLHGEQGLGDQICFASMVEDAQKLCNRLILHVDSKLVNLFRRSFSCSVYGNLGGQGGIWDDEDQEIDASYPMGQAAEFLRLTDESFPRKPFLKPDHDRVEMWKSLWRSKGKPAIGIAWSGGVPKTGQKMRRAPLEDWKPLFDGIRAHFVSLQYKPSQAEIAAFDHDVDLKEYRYATLTPDYDDTAALVASLDCVVTVPTAVNHLAGALGVPNVWMQHQVTCWKAEAGNPFHPVTSTIPWSGSWEKSISQAVDSVYEILGGGQCAVSL